MSKIEEPLYRRVLLKLSGEALLGKESYGIDSRVLGDIAEEINEIFQMGVQVAVVIGGGISSAAFRELLAAWIVPPPITWECWRP